MLILFLLLLGCALFTVLTPTLIMSALGLAATSVALSLIIFELKQPLAAVFELSVCAGLITAVFVSAISLTRRYSPAEERCVAAGRLSRFIWLPLLFLAAGGVYVYLGSEIGIPVARPLGDHMESMGVREVLWQARRLDLLGQLFLVLTGVFGVVVLFKGWHKR